jgi:hypothetical protein
MYTCSCIKQSAYFDGRGDRCSANRVALVDFTAIVIQQLKFETANLLGNEHIIPVMKLWDRIDALYIHNFLKQNALEHRVNKGLETNCRTRSFVTCTLLESQILLG